MSDAIRIVEFSSAYQSAAAQLINTNLGERFGFVDESMNPDLFDIGTSYHDGLFLLALDGNVVAGTGALQRVSNTHGQVMRMHTASTYRRKGIAAGILNALERWASSSGLYKLTLDTETHWLDAIGFYTRCGYTELGRDRVNIHFGKTLIR